MNLSGSGHTLSDVALDITVECMDDRGIRHEIDTVLGTKPPEQLASDAGIERFDRRGEQRRPRQPRPQYSWCRHQSPAAPRSERGR